MKQWMLAVITGVLVLLMPDIAMAHEGHLHKALGTVSAVDGSHVTIKKTDGKTLVVMLDKQTTVTRGKDKLDVAALKVGARVSVDYMEDKGMMMARGIKLSTASAPAKKN
jgi:hypothetical protein